MATEAIKLHDSKFKQVGEGMLDNRRRLGLGKAVDVLCDIFGNVPAKKLHFRIYCNRVGEIRLVPETTIPLREAWLHNNPTALKSVLTGIRQAEAGELLDLGSFEQFAATDLDDE